MVCARRPTLFAVGAADLDSSQVVEQFLEVGVADGWSPGIVGTVMEPDHTNTHTIKNPSHLTLMTLTLPVLNLFFLYTSEKLTPANHIGDK